MVNTLKPHQQTELDTTASKKRDHETKISMNKAKISLKKCSGNQSSSHKLDLSHILIQNLKGIHQVKIQHT